MSQRGVERIIGMLVTDEEFRTRFAENPGEALAQMAENGVELNEGERRALAGISARVARRFAEAIDPRLQKSDLAKESS